MSLSEIEDLRQQLDAFELPEKFLQKQSTSTVDTALLAKYKDARNDYLQRKMMHALIQQAPLTFDTSAANGFRDFPQVPTEEEQQALQERSDQVLRSVQEKSAHFQRQLLQLQAKHSLFLTRRDEFEQMNLLKDNHDDDDDDDDVSIDETELAAKQEKLDALQERRAALQVQLKTIQNRNDQAEKAVQANKAQFEMLQKENNNQSMISSIGQSIDYVALQNDPVASENLKKENAELRSKLEKVHEIQSFYKNLRLLTEELHGIRIVSVDKQSDDNNNNNMVLAVQLLHKYDVEVVLKTEKRDKLTVVSAKFVSDNTLVTGPPPANPEDAKDVGDLSPVQLQIPSLDDFVAIAATIKILRPGDNLRFLLRETIARIGIVQARVEELSVLQTEVLTKIGKFGNTDTTAASSSSSFGGQDQEVVCSLDHEQMTVVLRLTPDCPMVNGSVYMDQLVGLGGWDSALLEQIKTTVNDDQCASPVTLIRNLKAEILRLQEEEGLCLPNTPKLPVGRVGHEWK